MKKFFTLIELIVVIAVLGVLAAIIIPNISSFQEEANTTSIKSNVRNLQTGVDMYSFDNYSNVPTLGGQPTEYEPKPIDFDNMIPDYSRDLPETPGVKYWVDGWGKVWASTIDSPENVKLISTTLQWDNVPEADKYKVYKILNPTNTSSILNANTQLLFYKEVAKDEYSGIQVNEDNIAYAVSAVDKNGFESAPAGSKYQGYSKYEEKTVIDNNNYDFITTFPEVNLPTGEFLVSNNVGSQLYPQVSANGSKIVWMNANGSDYKIIGKDISKEEEFEVSSTDTRDVQIGFSADGSLVSWGTLHGLVYKDLNTNEVKSSSGRILDSVISAKGEKIFYTTFNNINGNRTLNVVDVATGDIQGVIGSYTLGDRDPNQSISNNGTIVVYNDYDSDIYYKEMETGNITTIEDHYMTDSNPYISANGSKVAWQRYDSPQWDIFIYDMNTKIKKNITNEGSHQVNPVLSADGKILIWEDYRNGSENPDIYGLNLETNQDFIVSNASSKQVNPVISADGNLVVWQDYRNGSWEIYAKNISQYNN